MACRFGVDVILLLTCLASFWVTYATSYQEYLVTNPKVCSPTSKKGKIKLSGSSDAAIVEETRTFDNWPGHIKFHCQFEVKDIQGDNDQVLFAVIQNLKFRQTPEGECIDYVEFESEDKRKRFCGEIGPSISSDNDGDDHEVAPYAFVGSDEIDVTIHVAHERLQPEENLDLKIAFTPGKKCYGRYQSRPPSSMIYCGDNTYCISSAYANDSIVNCPYTPCKDEGGCTSHTTVTAYHRPSVGTRVTIGAITTVLASFLLFFACIWLLRHYRKLCWSGDYSGQREVRMTPVPPVPTGPDALEAGTTGLDSSHVTSPTAPPLDRPVSTILPDKDMPPPYESLFPATSR